MIDIESLGEVMAYRSQNIAHRLGRLEREAVGAGKVLVAVMAFSDPRDVEEVLREQGVIPGPRDILVRCNRFSEKDCIGYPGRSSVTAGT
jgi:hypothetical protein